MKHYPHIFSPIQLGSVEIKNRIYMPPMATRYPHSSLRYVDYFRERAKNGGGLIFTGHVKAEKTIDKYQIGYPTLDTKADMRYFTELTETVHQYGAKIAVQLSAGTGRLANGVLPGDHPASASEVQMMYHPDMTTRALTKDEIKRLVEAYGVAAGNAKDAGFDFIYVHGLAFLIDQFLSPVWNHRTDEYGGPIENRMRFMMECIDSAKSVVGDRFPMLAGFSMNEGLPGGKTEEDCFILAKALEKKGIVGLHLRNGVYETTHLRITSNMVPTQASVERASRIREQVSIPVLTDGAMLDPDTCEALLKAGKIDMTGIGRPLLADPEWVRKAQRGQAEEIRPCLRCNECINRVRSGRYIGCYPKSFIIQVETIEAA